MLADPLDADVLPEKGMQNMNLRLILIWLVLSLSSCGHAHDKAERWEDDINFYASELTKRHINLFHTLSKSRFDEEIARIKESLPQ